MAAQMPSTVISRAAELEIINRFLKSDADAPDAS